MILLEDKRYYSYIYLDPRKHGIYRYGIDLYGNILTFLYEPIYVGKGKDKRIRAHIDDARLYFDKGNQHFLNKIRKIQKVIDGNPIFFKLLENATNTASCVYEINIISKIGRYDLGLGPLCNLTDGGESSINRIVPEYQRDKIRKSLTGYKHTEEAKLNMSLYQSNRKWTFSEESLKKKSDALRGERSPMWGTKLSRETKDKISNSLIGSKNGFYGKQHTDETIKFLSKMQRNNKYAAKSVKIHDIIYESLTAAGKELGVSGNTIRRRIDKNITGYELV